MLQQEELRKQEENVEHIHRRSAEIKEILHSSEPPLELQVSLPEFTHTCTEMLISCSVYCIMSIPTMYAVFCFR